MLQVQYVLAPVQQYDCSLPYVVVPQEQQC